MLRHPINLPRTLKLLAVAAYFVAFGAILGYQIPRHQFSALLQNKVLLHRKEILIKLDEAASTLANCLQFKRQYPLRYRAFHAMLRYPIYFGYDTTAEMAGNLAYAVPTFRTIALTDSYFSQPPAEQERTIAHEMLHLAGFPSHAKSNNFKNDPTYMLSDACYPQLPPEAE